MITYGGVGAIANQNYQTAAQPAIPAGAAAGDLLLCLSLARSTANDVLSSSWTTLSVADTANFYVLASYKIADGGGAPPTITPANMSSGQTHASRVSLWRGVDPIAPFGLIGAAAQFNAVTNVGPIAAPASAPADGAAVVLGASLWTWTDAAPLSGTLSWNEAWDEGTVAANAFYWVMDYATWNVGVPLTSKTFSITGGASSSVIGQMWTLNALQPPAAARRRGLSSMTFPPFP